VLIRLSHTPTRYSRTLFASIKFGIGWSGEIARDAKQGAKSIKRVVAAIKTEGEFIEICL